MSSRNPYPYIGNYQLLLDIHGATFTSELNDAAKRSYISGVVKFRVLAQPLFDSIFPDGYKEKESHGVKYGRHAVKWFDDLNFVALRMEASCSKHYHAAKAVQLNGPNWTIRFSNLLTGKQTTLYYSGHWGQAQLYNDWVNSINNADPDFKRMVGNVKYNHECGRQRFLTLFSQFNKNNGFVPLPT